MKSITQAATFALSALATLAACDAPTSVPTAAAPARHMSLWGTMPPLTLDEEFIAVGKTFPAFAGLYEEADSVVVVVANSDAPDQVSRSAAAAFFARHDNELRHLATRPRTVRPGRFSFVELATMRDALYRRPLPSGVVLVDVDERRNQLVIGVGSGAHLEPIEKHLLSLGLPKAAIRVHHEDLPKPTQDLGGPQRPVVGGLGITFVQQGVAKQCTLGWNVLRSYGAAVDSSVRYFLTNSHCSATISVGGFDATVYYQSRLGVAEDSVGEEAADPAPYSGGNCPVGWVCRYSDSNLVRYPAGVPWVHGASAWSTLSLPPAASPPYYGYLMAPTSATSPGSIGVVGVTTGEQTGASLVMTCFDRAFDATQTVWLRCQNRINKLGAGGDSGGPVFRYDSYWGFWRHPLGIRWAATWNTGNNTGLSDYSTVAGIEIDHGGLSFTSVCASFCFPW